MKLHSFFLHMNFFLVCLVLSSCSVIYINDLEQDEHPTYETGKSIHMEFSFWNFDQMGNVYLSGNFNRFKEKDISFKMQRMMTKFRITLNFREGRNSFRFIIDGKPVKDMTKYKYYVSPQATGFMSDGFGGTLMYYDLE